VIKMTGREYNAYVSDNDPVFWPEGAYMDDELVTVCGAEYAFDKPVPEGAKVTLEGGTFYRGDASEGTSLEAHFKRWRKAQNFTTLVIEFAKEDEAQVRAGLSAISAIKVLK
jgi:hypothetical protein